MASSLLDELPCLLEESDELIARLSFYLKLLFSPPPTNRAHPSDPNNDPFVLRQLLATTDVESIAKTFCKHILIAPSATSATSEKLDAVLPPHGSAPFQALQSLAAKIFHMMKRVHQWQQTTWDETLLPFFILNSTQLTFTRHRVLTSLVLTGITKSVKLHLLWSSYPHLAGILVLHVYLDSKKKAGHSTNSALGEPEVYRPLDFVLYFGSNPLIKIQQELQQHELAHNVARNMLELVLSCFDSYVGCHDLAHIKNAGQLFEIDTSVIQGSYASSPLYQDLLVLPQLGEWVLCVALCLPHQWKSEPIRNSSWQLWDFVQLIAQDQLVLVVARDLCVNIHDLLFQQLTSAISSAATTGATVGAGLQPLKKALIRLSKQAIQCGGARRRERRVLVLWFLRDCVKLLRHNAGLAAPLLPRLLAVLALAQDEIEWILAHHNAPKLSPTHLKTKYQDRAAKNYEIDPVGTTQLLISYYELRSLLETEADYIRRYYTQFIARGDADAIAKEIQRFLADDAPPHESRVLSMLQSFTERRRFQLAVTDAGFASWRREWQQLSVHLMAGSETGDDVAIPMSITMLLDRACRHANYVQAYEQLLLQVSSLSKCFWFQDVLVKCSHDIADYHDAKTDNVIIAVILNDLATGRAPVDELLEASEADHEVARLRRRVELLKLALGDQLQQAIEKFLVEEDKLHTRLSPLQMIERMGKESFQNGVSSSAKTTEKAATAMLLLTPGMESRLVTIPDAAVLTAQPLAAARTQLSAIVASLDRHVARSGSDPLALRELVSGNVQASIQRFLRGLVHENDGKLSLRIAWEDAVRQWHALRRCLHHQFQSSKWTSMLEMIQSTLASECDVGTHGADRSYLMDRVVAFYMAMLESKCVASGKSQVTLIVSFAPTPNYQLHRVQSVEMEPSAYASVQALGWLKEIVGHKSMLALRQVVEGYVLTHTKMLYGCLEKDKIALIRLKLAFPEDQSEIHMAVRIMETLDTGIVHELLCIGNGVFFLRILAAVDQSSSMDRSQKQAALLRQKLRALWSTSTSSDQQANPDDDQLATHVQTIWNLLPWAFVAAFYGAVWTKTKYLRAIDATTTNVHLLAPAMALLVETFEPRGPGQEASGPFGVDHETQRRARVRQVALVASQAVLSLRRVAAELPTPAMVAVAKQLTYSLTAAAPDGEVLDWLPDCLQQMSALGA